METVHYYEVSCWVDMEEPKAAMNTGGHDDFWKRFRVPPNTPHLITPLKIINF